VSVKRVTRIFLTVIGALACVSILCVIGLIAFFHYTAEGALHSDLHGLPVTIAFSNDDDVYASCAISAGWTMPQTETMYPPPKSRPHSAKSCMRNSSAKES
jgi:hypothetical protein